MGISRLAAILIFSPRHRFPSLIRRLLGEELVEEGVECRILTDDRLHNLPVRADDTLRWESAEVGALRFVDMLPWYLVLLDSSLPLLLSVVTVNAENLHLVFVLVVILLHLRYTPNAPYAP